jgi:hypothetical protein
MLSAIKLSVVLLNGVVPPDLFANAQMLQNLFVSVINVAA